ncbi:MAG TPA: DciA family protein [Tahibacter sp.]|uniref:DciA family protein n=1 Tax=Tahibacter sp. TaxID=2056211 RepID=UPI002CF969B0|nr:DciA family protein [Tahibacter sp.]HSX59777.1 DciA family protein [Tahibacter sp.]
MMFMPDSFSAWVSAMQTKTPSSAATSRRSSSGPKPVGETSPVASLIKRARALEALDLRLRLTLPPAIRPHCCLADARQGRVIFLANSSTWAAKLRLHQTPILAEAQKALGQPFKSFTVKVAPLPSVPPEPARRKPLSHTAAEHLSKAAVTLADPELRALFLKMASLAETTDSKKDADT